jgi:hypothetical protein
MSEHTCQRVPHAIQGTACPFGGGSWLASCAEHTRQRTHTAQIQVLPARQLITAPPSQTPPQTEGCGHALHPHAPITQQTRTTRTRAHTKQKQGARHSTSSVDTHSGWLCVQARTGTLFFRWTAGRVRRSNRQAQHTPAAQLALLIHHRPQTRSRTTAMHIQEQVC